MTEEFTFSTSRSLERIQEKIESLVVDTPFRSRGRPFSGDVGPFSFELKGDRTKGILFHNGVSVKGTLQNDGSSSHVTLKISISNTTLWRYPLILFPAAFFSYFKVTGFLIGVCLAALAAALVMDIGNFRRQREDLEYYRRLLVKAMVE